MFEWIFLLFFPSVVQPNEPPKKDYIGVVAAEAAYAALLPDQKVTPDQPIDPNCPTCHGTGKVKSGDGISWTKCPTCQPITGSKTPAAKPAMKLQVKPLPTPNNSYCPTGKCPYTRS